MTRFALLLALLTAACASAAPAPIAYGRDGDRAVAQPFPPAPSNVADGRTAPRPPPSSQEPDWADGEGAPLSTYALRPEDVQPFDPAHLPRSHRIGPNETLYDVATRYQIPVLVLIDHNGLEPPYTLTPGRALDLPAPRFHTVARGESFEDVARRYNVDTRSLALLNRMQPPYGVRQGDRIVLPAVPGVGAAAPTAQASNPAAEPATTPARPLHGPARFAMPLNGDVVTRFGAQPGGVRIDGIEIAGREGSVIRAAADGDVVYAGADLEAYGTLVLVRHADNYVTAYGYGRRALVREGDRVRAGQDIAELGARADGRARLLFQVRQGSTAVDPLSLLGRAD